jgi:hypothetical protein
MERPRSARIANALQTKKLNAYQRQLASKRARVPYAEWKKRRPKRKSCADNPLGRHKFIRQGKSWWVKSPGYCKTG